jgi:uncharacterized protein YbbK (DUF523 family)
MKILVSACLLGQPVRYDARSNQSKLSDQDAKRLTHWQRQGWVVPVCPETLGGLPTPRPAAEIQGGDGAKVLAREAEVLTQAGLQVTDAFLVGAERTLALAKSTGACAALLAAKSPSCGNAGTYDGTFSKQLTTAMGVTAALLSREDIHCFNPEQMDMLAELIESIQTDSNRQ